jgi:hypothetical protein
LEAKGKGKAGRAKINIRPVPTSEDSWSWQHELNIYNGTLYFADTVAFSTTSDWDFSVSTQNIPVYGGGAQNFQDDTYLQISKTIRWTENISTIIGTQSGYQFYTLTQNQPTSPGKVHLFEFEDNQFKLNDNLTLHGGAFWVNAALSTQTAYVGGLAGLKIDYADLMFQADYVGGHTNVSGAYVTLHYFVVNYFAPYFGVIVPEQNSGNEFAGVAGFMLSTGNLR